MDADTLRLILFLAGIALILGIYLWDRRKRAGLRIHAVRREKRVEPVVPEAADASEEEEETVAGGPPLPQHEPVWRREPVAAADTEPAVRPRRGRGEPEEEVEEALRQLTELVQEEAPEKAPKEEQIAFQFDQPESGKEEPAGVELPRKILQLNVRVRRGGLVTGPRILAAAESCGLVPGEMQIFHHYSGGSRQPLFSMASLVEPGVFPFDDMDAFTTPGVTLFAQLPGPLEAMETFDRMLEAARKLASALDGEIQDETHSDLSRQTIEHIREEIREYGRQLRLARSRR